MVVKDSKTRKKAGRPPGDPADLRTERIALRVHANLLEEIDFLAREAGFVRSVMIERILIAYVNHANGVDLLDAIGRLLPGVNPLIPGSTRGMAPPQWVDRLQAATRPGLPRPGSAQDHPSRRYRKPQK
jgi:hypothetical protein